MSEIKNGIYIEDGQNVWYVNDKEHRIDGPAVEYPNGTKEWYINGERHREDGPAVESADGYKFWFLNGVQLTEEQFWQTIKKDLNEKLEFALLPKPIKKRLKI